MNHSELVKTQIDPDWEALAASFDDQPDHSLAQPEVRQAWTELLRGCLPSAGLSVLEVGCGTGSISAVLAELGHQVTAIDASLAMIERARVEVARLAQSIELQVMDAAALQFAPQSFDVIVGRHVLWVFADTADILQHWVDRLKPGGRLVLIEGYWNGQVGLRARAVIAALPASVVTISLQNLSERPAYWGLPPDAEPLSDERYAIVAEVGLNRY